MDKNGMVSEEVYQLLQDQYKQAEMNCQQLIKDNVRKYNKINEVDKRITKLETRVSQLETRQDPVKYQAVKSPYEPRKLGHR